jgi:hypothetical protein
VLGESSPILLRMLLLLLRPHIMPAGDDFWSCGTAGNRICAGTSGMPVISYPHAASWKPYGISILSIVFCSLLDISVVFCMQGVDRYIKKKAMDPLVSYIPVLLIASEQLEYVQLAASDLGCDETRSLLRKGAFVALRDNIRSIGEYTSATCGKETAQARVKRVFASLEALDGALLVVWACSPGAICSCSHNASSAEGHPSQPQNACIRICHVWSV